MRGLLDILTYILGYELHNGTNVRITVGTVVFAIVVFIITHLTLKIIKKGTIKLFAVKDENGDNGRIDTVFNFLSYFVYVIVFFSIISAIGININMLLTATAALFVGLGFALQQIFQDLIAGIYILLDRTLNVGDIIQVDGKVAKVKVINLRSTLVETRDSRIIVIPNRTFVNEKIYNWTQDHVVIRAQVDIGVYIGTDVRLVEKILLQSLEKTEGVLPDPEPSVIIENFGESSIRFALRYYLDDAFNNDKIASDIRFEIDRLFKENGIQLPVPVIKLNQTI